jgi:hypothetical protein
MPPRRATLALTATLALAACKPPPTDSGLVRAMPDAAPTFASEPLASPDTTGAAWVETSPTRIVYGIPGEPALMSLECLGKGHRAQVRITRISPADEGAGALMALIGNGEIGRIAVDATPVKGRLLWQSEVPAADPRLDPLIGAEEVTATVPGAGKLVLNPHPLPTEMLAECRSDPRAR